MAMVFLPVSPKALSDVFEYFFSDTWHMTQYITIASA